MTSSISFVSLFLPDFSLSFLVFVIISLAFLFFSSFLSFITVLGSYRLAIFLSFRVFSSYRKFAKDWIFFIVSSSRVSSFLLSPSSRPYHATGLPLRPRSRRADRNGLGNTALNVIAGRASCRRFSVASPTCKPFRSEYLGGAAGRLTERNLEQSSRVKRPIC